MLILIGQPQQKQITQDLRFFASLRMTMQELGEYWIRYRIGTTTEVHHYSFMDESLQSGDYQYRLKQIDFDGTFEYSNIIEVTVDVPAKFALEQNYPNPFNPTTKIKFTIPVNPPSSPFTKEGNGDSRGGLYIKSLRCFG